MSNPTQALSAADLSFEHDPAIVQAPGHRCFTDRVIAEQEKADEDARLDADHEAWRRQCWPLNGEPLPERLHRAACVILDLGYSDVEADAILRHIGLWGTAHCTPAVLAHDLDAIEGAIEIDPKWHDPRLRLDDDCWSAGPAAGAGSWRVARKVVGR